MMMDPLRVRVRFFEAISSNDRLAVFQDARAKLRGHLALTRATANQDKRHGDTFRDGPSLAPCGSLGPRHQLIGGTGQVGPIVGNRRLAGIAP